jgi:hypothetical protein
LYHSPPNSTKLENDAMDSLFTTYRRCRYYRSPIPFESMPCAECQTQTDRPRWVRVELGLYSGICPACYHQLDLSFTAEQAICHALIIVGMWQGAHPIGGVR